jgi:hypothetical protein
MARQTVTSLLFFVVAGLPQTSAATNYHEYKRFEPPRATGEVLRTHHAALKQRWNGRQHAAKPASRQ